MAKQILKNIWKLRKFLVVVLAPVLLLPILFAAEGKEVKCGYIILLVAIFWISEALPIAVTALLPVVLFPLVGIANAKDISTAYVNDTSMLFVGGLILAYAIEHWNIHKLFALRVLLWFGSEPHWLMLGMMVPTCFLSMWMSNTATSVMMLPIANAVLLQLKNINITTEDTDTEYADQSSYQDRHINTDLCSKDDVITTENARDLDQEKHADQNHMKLCKALSMSICYAANIGGIASLTGTGVNIIMKGQTDILFQKYGVENPITFATWMEYGIPIAVVLLLMSWIWLIIYFLGFGSLCKKQAKETSSEIRHVLRREYDDLGSVTFAQGAVIGHFLAMCSLWITRDLGGIGGWKDLFPEKTVTDSTSCILVACSLFFFPANLPEILRSGGSIKIQPLINWKSAEKNISWGIIWLFGGGFALAKGSQETGLSDWIGDKLSVFSGLDIWVLNIILCYIVAAFTEVASNSATATLMLPIVAQLGLKLEVNPLYLVLPVTIAASISFMLPVATPPNAVVFSYGYIKVIDMIKTGLLMNIVPIPIVVLLTEFLGNSIFNLKTFPVEFRNATV